MNAAAGTRLFFDYSKHFGLEQQQQQKHCSLIFVFNLFLYTLLHLLHFLLLSVCSGWGREMMPSAGARQSGPTKEGLFFVVVFVVFKPSKEIKHSCGFLDHAFAFPSGGSSFTLGRTAWFLAVLASPRCFSSNLFSLPRSHRVWIFFKEEIIARKVFPRPEDNLCLFFFFFFFFYRGRETAEEFWLFFFFSLKETWPRGRSGAPIEALNNF